jgi:hypothetical protein
MIFSTGHVFLRTGCTHMALLVPPAVLLSITQNHIHVHIYLYVWKNELFTVAIVHRPVNI